ncbi:MAG: hypothetical protein IKE01_00200 [Clostridia bacterium]|nr:hypothetical protein [Clostridia bacterium]
MDKGFDDIFESLKQLHKKYSSEEYLSNLDTFNKNSEELQTLLEKYNTDEVDDKKQKKKSK